eukprot:Cvel_3744.t2-p1 / transcript=Cvel_3744.t2 / gene=Cvel_3744 / organism=Chromera_velia_CCMP2878 / gene_product=hypothetical protein / transcript_product=hypothetical protein / location=Cvel_scaffold156:43235-45109(-) / protein_length=625 / sequence_SO=supercontig / SO=protein_coding / is_pseudo=false
MRTNTYTQTAVAAATAGAGMRSVSPLFSDRFVYLPREVSLTGYPPGSDFFINLSAQPPLSAQIPPMFVPEYRSVYCHRFGHMSPHPIFPAGGPVPSASVVPLQGQFAPTPQPVSRAPAHAGPSMMSPPGQTETGGPGEGEQTTMDLDAGGSGDVEMGAGRGEGVVKREEDERMSQQQMEEQQRETEQRQEETEQPQQQEAGTHGQGQGPMQGQLQQSQPQFHPSSGSHFLPPPVSVSGSITDLLPIPQNANVAVPVPLPVAPVVPLPPRSPSACRSPLLPQMLTTMSGTHSVSVISPMMPQIPTAQGTQPPVARHPGQVEIPLRLPYPQPNVRSALALASPHSTGTVLRAGSPGSSQMEVPIDEIARRVRLPAPSVGGGTQQSPFFIGTGGTAATPPTTIPTTHFPPSPSAALVCSSNASRSPPSRYTAPVQFQGPPTAPLQCLPNLHQEISTAPLQPFPPQPQGISITALHSLPTPPQALTIPPTQAQCLPTPHPGIPTASPHYPTTQVRWETPASPLRARPMPPVMTPWPGYPLSAYPQFAGGPSGRGTGFESVAPQPARNSIPHRQSAGALFHRGPVGQRGRHSAGVLRERGSPSLGDRAVGKLTAYGRWGELCGCENAACS